MTWTHIIKEMFQISNPRGYSKEEIESAKKYYGSLPSVLEQFYLELGKCDELQNLQDFLILPGKYPVLLYYDYLVFFNENQGVCQAGIHIDDIKKDNPPVYVGFDNDEWTKTSDSLTDFLTAMFEYQASICLEYSPEEFYWVSPEEILFIKKHFLKRKQSLEKWLECKIELYGNSPNESIALMYFGGDVQMNYAANNKVDFENMQRILQNVGEGI